ncbi:MAG: ATP-binding cassette domain-containing protein [Dongiaceae bacterium]
MGAVPLLRIEGISKRFGAVQALDDAGFDIARGEVVALLGDNGAGKSTLVKVISGTCAPDRGGLSFDGRPVHIHNPADSKRLGIETVYQDLSLCENMNVVANFFMGRELCRRMLGFSVLRERDMQARTEEALRRIGAKIPSVLTNVEFLSGGQRQAIELCRFVAWGGRLALLDEPFAALGVEQTTKGLELIQRVKAEGLSIMVITHNLGHALQMADHIVVMRQGRVVGDMPRAAATTDGLVGLITGDVSFRNRA